MKNFVNGVNLGGWLSQYKNYDHEHFRTFITKSDIDQIASWGIDHVRLPVDYPVLEADDAVGVPLEDGYAYIDNCIAWCADAGLALMLDLHKAPSFSFNNDINDETRHLNTLFESPEAQDRFVGLWEELATRYHDAPIPIVFELLNELVIPDVTPWNALIARTVAAIRAIAPEAPIMVGGNNYNGAKDLHDLTLIDDPNIFYTFHYYHPMLFTHQKAPWSPAMRDFDTDVTYPGEFPGLEEYAAAHPEYARQYAPMLGKRADIEILKENLEPAIEFANKTGFTLYCGEYGVAEWVDPASRRRWLKDFLGLLDAAGFSRALWNYKLMDFGLVDGEGKVVDQEFLDILVGKA